MTVGRVPAAVDKQEQQSDDHMQQDLVGSDGCYPSLTHYELW
jgi:hypothetical protein